MANYLAIRTKSFSRLFNLRTSMVACLLSIVCLAIALASMSLGKHAIPPWDALAAMFGHGDKRVVFILEVLRLPRMLTALMAGGALAISGLFLQSIVRNPLASPDILGMTGGASAAAVFFLSFLAPGMSMQWLPLVSIFGAFLAAACVYLLAWKHGGVSPLHLVLTGVGVSVLMASLTTLMMVLSPISSTLSAYVWLTGSVFGATWRDVSSLFLWLCAIAPFVILLQRSVGVYELGDMLGQGLGLPLEKARFLLLTLSVVLAGVAISHAGAMAFVGLVSPHIARRLVARSFGGLVVVSALIGAIMVMLADLAGRTLFQPLDLPAGIFVSAFGAVFFVYLLMRYRV